jgi:hypothetical protein
MEPAGWVAYLPAEEGEAVLDALAPLSASISS